MAGVLDLWVRPGTAEDLSAVADLYLRARTAAVGLMPRLPQDPAGTVAWVRGWDLGAVDLWIAELAEVPVGFAAATDTWLDHLYVDPRAVRQGVGSALLGVVQATRPEGFGLWVYESNRRALSFYARHGLTAYEPPPDEAEDEPWAPRMALRWAGDGGGSEDTTSCRS